MPSWIIMRGSSCELSTKIHVIYDALGNPIDFHLTAGQDHDLDGADILLENLQANALLADKAYDADERVLSKLESKNCQPVIPSKSNRKIPREYDKFLYQARHLVDNFFAKLKQYRSTKAIYDKKARNFLGWIYLAATLIWLN